MDYAGFQTLAFAQYGIPTQPLQVVREWIEREFWLWDTDNDRVIVPSWDMGYAELADIQTVDQGMRALRDYAQGWEAEGKRAFRRWLANPSPRGRGFYRIALKTYYLCQGE